MKLPEPAWPRFLPGSFVLGCATLGPIGRRLPAPGTWGSAAGLVYFTVLFYPLGPAGYALLCAAGLYLAVALCGEAEFRLGKKDPGEVILDEFAAMPLCFLGWPRLLPTLPVWGIMLAGFALFRLFDIAKPLGIRRLQDLPGGWGVVVDDVAAALAACVTLHLAVWAWRTWA
ncbi:MAG TPA: phosphatidylglycerophosphatase A [Opitutaceae bacterium]|jgi:phosphatidylglycerophosphatase A|nr:phosphatidylglycerophosphatase A [Opitutaceae bacterium]